MNWTYILECGDGSYYTGWTNDLEKRLQAHSGGSGAKYTRGRGPVRLVWAMQFETQSQAMAEEARIKKLARPEKERLVAAYPARPARKAPEDG